MIFLHFLRRSLAQFQSQRDADHHGDQRVNHDHYDLIVAEVHRGHYHGGGNIALPGTQGLKPFTGFPQLAHQVVDCA